MKTVHLEIEILSIYHPKCEDGTVRIAVKWVDEYGDVRKTQTYTLLEGDIISWKKFTKGYNID
jgi:hypothetical protein